MFGLFRRPVVVEPMIVERVIPPENFRYIWSHQLVVMNRITIRLKERLFYISRDLTVNRQNYIGKFPYVVGEQGNLISPSFVRCVFNSLESEKSSVNLEYKVCGDGKRKIILRFIGNDPQRISIIKDERLDDAGPLILIIPKLNPKHG